jgi:galactitol-specific phosphotransferase system IIB component
MLGTRRSFFKDVAQASGALLFCQGCPPIPEPRRKTPIDPPAPAEPQSPDSANTSNSNTLVIQKRTQEKEFRQAMEDLFVHVRDLKAELDHTPTSNVFSVDIFKRTQEIEKLAKRLKTYAKV